MNRTTAFIAGTMLIFLVPVSAMYGQEEANEASIEAAIESLVIASNDPNPDIRQRAFVALQRIPTSQPVVIERIRQGLTGKNAEDRQQSIEVLRRQSWTDEQKGKLLFEMLTQEDLAIAQEAVDIFESAYQTSEIDNLLKKIASPKTTGERLELFLLVISASRQNVEKILPVLEELYAKSDMDSRIRILNVIGNYGELAKPGLQFLAEQTKVEESEVRVVAINAIERVLAPPRRSNSRSLRSSTRVNRSMSGRQQAYVDALFSRYDTNSDGELGSEEIKKISVGIRLIDNDRDGVINRQEALDSVAGHGSGRGR